jgi:hypothetical protein
MALVLPALLCVASGFVVVGLGCSRQYPRASDLALRVALSFGFGLGIFSVVFFLARVSGVTNLIALDLVMFALLLASFFSLRTRAKTTATIPPAKFDGPNWLHRTLAAAFAIALCAAIYSAVLRSLAHPHGDGWDAFAIWNLHARFLFRAGADWRDGFSSLIPWSHPDYPLLLPAAIAHFWTYPGNDAPAVPAVIGLVFTFATVALLFSSLSILRGSVPAMLGATTLLATPSFIALGSWQYADIPLSFFFLATIVLLRLYDDPRDNRLSAQHSPGFLALAGLAAGFAAWTKNEGILFLGAIVFPRCLLIRNSRVTSLEPRPAAANTHIVPFLVTVVPIFLLISYFKHFIAPPGDLFSDPTTMLHKLLDPTRCWIIIKSYAKEFFRFGHWLFVPAPLLILAFYFVTRQSTRGGIDSRYRASVLALALTLAGYFAIYLLTPYDLYWHLRFSLTRLFLQLWPSAIFLFFLAVPPPRTASELPRQS